MTWSDAATYFFGGIFLANFVPHFVAGVSGRRFPSPFAKPRFRGLSSPASNVLWGLLNAAASYALFMVLGSFDPHHVLDVAVAGVGFSLASIGIARSISRSQADAPAA
ncbi:MAG: hypothetical protein A2138_09440 [Deltaproteobacteria bacterium RBG_16_71_12]|nr:MAG: hypothetical protein A2138_09440 [Deltaproteobacteria bacterium RBG_16_71_12]